jgi:WD40 repeat protein
VNLSPNDEFIISASNDKTIKFWDVIDGKCLRTIEEHNNVIYNLYILYLLLININLTFNM